MSSNSPTRSFVKDPRTENFESLYLEIVKRYYSEGDPKRAEGVAARLNKLLAISPEAANSIRGEEVRSIIAELRGDLLGAIQSREAEIRKIYELHARTENTPSWNYVSRQYSFSDVSDRLDLLANLYDKHGELDRAINILEDSERYCLSRKVPFDARDFLDELRQARESKLDPKPTQSVAPRALDEAIKRVFKSFRRSADDIVVEDPASRHFTNKVNELLPQKHQASITDVKRRLLTLRRRTEARGGLPKPKR